MKVLCCGTATVAVALSAELPAQQLMAELTKLVGLPPVRTPANNRHPRLVTLLTHVVLLLLMIVLVF